MNIIDYIIRFQLNLFAIILLVVLYGIIKLKRDIYRFSTWMLNSIIWLTITALIVEPLSFIFDGNDTLFGIILNYFSNYALIMVSPILVGMWASYLDYQIFGNRKRLRKVIFYQQGSIIVFALCVLNAFIPFFFSLNAEFHYSSGPFQWAGYIFVYTYYIYIVVVAIINRKRMSNSVIYGIIAFFVLPLFGSMMQMSNSNLFFTWTMMAMATFVVYIFLETTTGIRDFLTKLYSRRTLENYLTHLFEIDNKFGIMMLDLNSFKSTNDRFGHQVGDLVLVRFSELLSSAFKEEKMVARLGGDEFFVVIEKLDLETTLIRVNELLEKFATDSLLKQYKLTGFSFGIAMSEKNKNIDDLFLAADRAMYRNKPKSTNENK